MRRFGGIFLFVAACAPPVVSPPRPAHSIHAAPAPPTVPTTRVGLALPASWVSNDPILVRAFRDCAPESVDERWEHSGSHCIRSRSVVCPKAAFADRIRDYCASGDYGEVQVHRFKIDTARWCAGKASEIRAEWPWNKIQVTHEIAAACDSIEPAWVPKDVERLRPIVGNGPRAAAYWQDHVGESGHVETFELEWSPASYDSASLVPIVEARGYARVTDQTDSAMWSKRKENEYSFMVTKNGYRDNRLVVGRWLATKALTTVQSPTEAQPPSEAESQ